MASINVLNQWIYLECVRARFDVYGIILVIWFNMFWYQEWMGVEFSHSCALKCLSTEWIIQFWYKKRKTYHTYNMLQTFLQIGYLCKTHRIFSDTVFMKKKANSFQNLAQPLWNQMRDFMIKTRDIARWQFCAANN